MDHKVVPPADLLPEAVEDWTRVDSISTYDRESIFRYINGAGEVYNSFAFGEVAVGRYRRGEQELLVELFDMGNSADAYGAFSYARENELTGLGGGYEQRGRVLCFWQNRYYCCLAHESGEELSPDALLTLARRVSERLPSDSKRPALVSALPADGLLANSERFFHVQAAFNYNYYLARENLLKLSEATDVVLARYEPGSMFVGLIEYPDSVQASEAVNSFRIDYLAAADGKEIVQLDNSKHSGVDRTGRFGIVVLDAESETFVQQTLAAAVHNLKALGK